MFSMRRLLRPVFCAALFCLYPALVQAAAESEILGLFQRWQAAHGQRSGKALEGVYAPRLDYYGRAQTRERTLSAKQAFFARHPDFEQRIVAAPQIVPGDQEGRYEVRFVKQVRLDGRLRNYPGLLLAERAGPGDTWRFVGESDEITRYAVDPRYTPLARGRFAGTEADFAWVVAHAPNSAALCDEYEDCRCDLWSADARVPPKPLGSCTGAVLSVLGGLDDSGRERLQLLRTWWTSTWTKSSLLEIRDGQWVRVLPDISTTWDDAEAQLVLYKADPQQPGRVLVTETVMDDEGDWSHRTRSEALRPVP
ncbi:TPA: hypothetical protein L4U70_005712 [Pseudomonas aeruginosa]|nr:hypothetical protein [Pseudomonas aeruginosa]HCE6276535.1 hypothetical protein [Pseudomonas aeruginosa]HCE8567842.1 hypothetical protein [Pseudomonas aeruginosa]HCR1449272.1 hypothetical protein [Pseudomonas aeruginosa]